MKLTHIDAFLRDLGYRDTVDYIQKEYIKKRRTLEDVADEMEVGVQKLRAILAFLHIEKPRKEIPITLDQARRMRPEDLGLMYGVSRATAWRWKRIILSEAADAAKGGATVVLDADVT